jgi:hypothetical protein
MRGIQRLGAIVAASLLLPNTGWARTESLGIVTMANHAELGGTAASEGSSVFDGDRLATHVGGMIEVRSGKVRVYLNDESSAIVRRNIAKGENLLKAELERGHMILATAEGASTEIVALVARIRPSGVAAGILEVRVLGPNTLSISARRGTAKFSYGGEDAVIVGGKWYRVELNPPDGSSGGDEKNKKAADKKKKKKFILIAIGGGAAAAGIAAGVLLSGSGAGSGTGQSFESPDRP